MAYTYFKDLSRKTTSYEVLRDKAFNIAKNSKYDEYQPELASMVYKFFYKKLSGGAATRANKSSIKSEIMSNQQLAEELRKSIIRKFEKPKVYPSFKDKIWGADLADMQPISHYQSNHGCRIIM